MPRGKVDLLRRCKFMKHYEYIIVIPTYNERDNIKLLIMEARKRNPKTIMLVIDDNSPDGTADIVSKLRGDSPGIILLKSDTRKGLAKSYRLAFSYILQNYLSEWVVTMDADFSHNPRDVGRLLRNVSAFDMVVGSRFMVGGSSVNMGLWRRALSNAGNWYARRVTGVPLTDLTSGFVAYRSAFLSKLLQGSFDNDGFACQIEMKCKAFRRGARIMEIPIVFGKRSFGQSKLSFRIIIEGLFAPWFIRFASY